jgi:hypothetical protein
MDWTAAIIMAGLIVLVLVSGVTARFLFKPQKPPVDLSEIQQQLILLGEQQEALTAELQSALRFARTAAGGKLPDSRDIVY